MFWFDGVDVNVLLLVEGNFCFGFCVIGIGKFMCIGLNYVDYVVESGLDVLFELVFFMKVIFVICGFNDLIIILCGLVKIDWEVEFGVVIGKVVKYVEEIDVLFYVVGYCVVNDVFECEFQIEW